MKSTSHVNLTTLRTKIILMLNNTEAGKSWMPLSARMLRLESSIQKHVGSICAASLGGAREQSPRKKKIDTQNFRHYFSKLFSKQTFFFFSKSSETYAQICFLNSDKKKKTFFLWFSKKFHFKKKKKKFRKGFFRKGQLEQGLEALPSDVEQCCHVVVLKTKILTGLQSLILIFLVNISGFEI